MGYHSLDLGYVKRTICVRFILLFLLSYVDMVVWILEGGNGWKIGQGEEQKRVP